MLPVVTYNVVTYIVENTYIAVAYKRSRLPTHSNQQQKTRLKCEICSELTINAIERSQ